MAASRNRIFSSARALDALIATTMEIVQRHLTSNHIDMDQEPDWLRNGVHHRLTIQGWTQMEGVVLGP